MVWVISDVFDSADGQLARLRGASTRFGRALDGISDSLRFAYLYLCLLLRLLAAGAGWPAVALVVVAAASHSLQATIVDFIRSAYLWAGFGEGTVDLPEDVAAPAAGRWLARVSGRIYRDYVLRQAFVLPDRPAVDLLVDVRGVAQRRGRGAGRRARVECGGAARVAARVG